MIHRQVQSVKDVVARQFLPFVRKPARYSQDPVRQQFTPCADTIIYVNDFSDSAGSFKRKFRFLFAVESVP